MDEDISNMIKKFKEMEAKIKRSESISERYIEYSKELVELHSQLSKLGEKVLEIAKNIDPVPFSSVSGTRAPRMDYDEMLRPIYEKMVAGTNVYMKTLKAMYPDFKYFKVYTMYCKLKEMTDIEEGIDKNSDIFLYYKRKE